MLKLCIDNTSTLHEFHLYEPYLYEVMKSKDCYFLNDFSKNNSDIEKLDITICSAENILLERRKMDYEVTVVTELFNNDLNLIRKLYEIEKHITSKFLNNKVQKTQNIKIIIMDHTGNSYVDFKEELYVVDGQSDLYFTREDLTRCEGVLKVTNDKNDLVRHLIDVKNRKTICKENEWYFYIFSKMIEHFYDQNIIQLNQAGTYNLIEIFKKLMSYYVKKSLIDNIFIIRFDVSEQRNITSTQRKNFLDMNKFVALITFDMQELFSKSKPIIYKGVYNVNIGLDEDKVNNMLKQYAENLKIQIAALYKRKATKIEVQNRAIPNVSLRTIYLEPVKIKNERLTFFRSSRNIQYLDRIEKNLTNEMNMRIKKVKSNNIKNICDLRTLRYVDDANVPKTKLSLIEIKDRIDEKINLFKRKNAQMYKKKADYYAILDDFLKKQKIEKEKIINEIKIKVKFKEYFFITFLLFLISALLVFTSNTNIITDSFTTKDWIISPIALGSSFIIASIIIFSIENAKIKKMIDKYLAFVNTYNDKLQISSNDELKKLVNTYELIILNGDIEYYKDEYSKLLNQISKYEFHISQLEKHIEIAKRLCSRAGINFDDIVIADDSLWDEKNVDVDVDKDVYQNPCYSITRFLFKTKNYCIMLNSGEVIEKLELETYIKSMNFTEDEVYKF